ncbi:hypothetical protein IFM89_026924 [Coptis chinensis]|uniref:Uncharacterized protein n=1 Tax=Coptis chinensis TaxID=261450 RepID=A0A835GZK7_9MAGN|nr:hypothetical protein IFM89_026924 [Coptis chinensis]
MDDNRKVEALENGKKDGEQPLTEEQVFEEKEEVFPWSQQITPRSIGVSTLLSVVFTFVVMKLNVTTGIVPSLNVPAGLLGFFFVKIWIYVLSRFGIQSKKFTRQENTVIQTSVVASSGVAFSSGLASYVLGMSGNVASQAGTGNTPSNIKNLSLQWIIPFVFCVSFQGLFSIVPMRKTMILGYKLTYPSGTATANLINSFHTPKGEELALKKVKILFYSFGGSFLWAFFQWFFTASDNCGFASFPTFGLKAFKYKFYFDFSTTYVGVGMLCSHFINLSMAFGAIVSWGIMWPLIEKRKGDWYSADLPSSSLSSLQGYKVFITIAIILADGLFSFVYVLWKVISNMKKLNKDLPVSGDPDIKEAATVGYDEQRRTKYFLKDNIPMYWSLIGYVALAAISSGLVPLIYHQLKFYHILVIYLIAPVLAFCNSYGCGLTDWSLASSYGKIAILVLSAWVGDADGGVIAGLAACGVMMSIVSSASDLMQDFRTGYLTLSSSRSMFFSQIIGTVIGCITSPLIFWYFFYKAYPDMGQKGSAYPAPFGAVYRGIALIGVQGTSALPKHCLNLCLGFFIGTIVLNIVRELLAHKKFRVSKFIPSPMAMAIPFYLGPYFVIDMCVGSVIKFVWEKMNKANADAFVPATASGLICGDSLWGMPAAILSLVGVKPPLCMKFLSSADNDRVTKFLDG